MAKDTHPLPPNNLELSVLTPNHFCILGVGAMSRRGEQPVEETNSTEQESREIVGSKREKDGRERETRTKGVTTKI